MSAAFTPGPWDFGWHQASGDFTLHYGSDEHTGPSLLEGGLVLADDKQNEANAHLIAAAPKLYETINRVADQLVSIEGRTKGDKLRLLDQLHVLGAASAEARGEQ